jgi:hypothetical protein
MRLSPAAAAAAAAVVPGASQAALQHCQQQLLQQAVHTPAGDGLLQDHYDIWEVLVLCCVTLCYWL